MSKMDLTVEQFYSKTQKWQEEYAKLRAIALGCQLSEGMKWGQPCYTYDGNNIVLIHGFKEYCAYLFFKGVLLPDPQGILIQQTANVQAGRQIRFTSLRQIKEMEAVLKAYILAAIEVEKSGLKVELKPTAAYSVPAELQRELDADPALKTAFEALTPGRQRAYILHCAAPKTAKTRESRVGQCVPQILKGKGLYD